MHSVGVLDYYCSTRAATVLEQTATKLWKYLYSCRNYGESKSSAFYFDT